MLNRLGIVVDSTCEYSLVNKMFKDALVLPLTFFISGRPYLDVDINNDELQKKLYYNYQKFDIKEISTQDYIVAFNNLDQSMIKTIICVVSKKMLSKSFVSLTLAKDILKNRDIHIVDVDFIGPGYLNVLEMIKTLMDQGESIQKILDKATHISQEQKVFISQIRDKNIFKRISNKIFNVKKIFQLENGSFVLKKRTMRISKVFNHYINEINKQYTVDNNIRVYIFYKSSASMAKNFYQELYNKLPNLNVIIYGQLNFSLSSRLHSDSIGILIGKTN